MIFYDFYGIIGVSGGIENMTSLAFTALQVDIGTISTLIGSVGFPVALCIGLLWYLMKLQQTHKEELVELQNAHKEESDKLSEAISNNTIVMQQILEHMRKEDEKQ